MVDIRQSSQYAKYLSQIGWIVERESSINYFIKKIPFLGCVIKIQRPEGIKIVKIKELCKKYRVFQVIIEPKTKLDAKYLNSLGYKLLKTPYLPTKTLYLDLTKSKNEITKQFKKDCINAITRNNDLEIKDYKFKDIETFRKGWKKVVKEKRHVPSIDELKALKKAFNNNVLFLGIKDKSKAISGGVFLKSNRIAYYWHGFSDQNARTLQAQYKIVWESICWAKTCGTKLFDFEGIYDPRFPNPKWMGFSHFKKSFGGEEKEFPGAFTKYFLPL